MSVAQPPRVPFPPELLPLWRKRSSAPADPFSHHQRTAGPAGLAILGARGRDLVPRTVVLYDSSKKPHVTEAVGADFALFPQENLYATFYSSDGQGWSTLLKSYGDWEARPRRGEAGVSPRRSLRVLAELSCGTGGREQRALSPIPAQALARSVAVARCIAASLSATPAVVTQDVAVGDPGGTLTVEPGDTVQVSFSQWAEDPSARGEPGALVAQRDAVKLELLPDAAPRGLVEGVAGMRRGGKRFIAVPARAVCVGAPLPSAPETIFYLVTLNRIKKGSKSADGRSPGSAMQSRAGSPTPGQQQQQHAAEDGAHARAAAQPAPAPQQPQQQLAGAEGGSGLTTPQVSRPNSPRRLMANMMMTQLTGCARATPAAEPPLPDCRARAASLPQGSTFSHVLLPPAFPRLRNTGGLRGRAAKRSSRSLPAASTLPDRKSVV